MEPSDAELVRQAVTQLIRLDPCNLHCLQGKAAALELFVLNVTSFTPAEKKASIYTALSILMVAEDAQPPRSRTRGSRVRFRYFVPFVGHVCKQAFLYCFNVSAPTVARYKSFIRAGLFRARRRMRS